MTDPKESTSTQKAIEQLLEEVSAEERRSSERYPFFRPVTIAPESEKGRTYSAFSRDLSTSGIGLLHNMPLDIDEATLTIGGGLSGPVKLRAKIQWCQPTGEGWYISGGEFLPDA